MQNPLRIGTRRSPLALKQTEMTIAALARVAPHITTEIVPMNTTADANQKACLAEIGGKGLFAKEIENALLEGRIDIAVHSCKDMETTLPEGLIIPCMLPRADVRDALIIRKDVFSTPPADIDILDALHGEMVIGSSSVRRMAQLLNRCPELTVNPFRGNVQTRLQKLRDGAVDATMLAYAGIKRLGIEPEIREEFLLYVLPVETWLPAVAQGAIAVECRSDDAATRELLQQINHPNTVTTTTAERAMLNRLDGSCKTAVSVHATLSPDASQLSLKAILYSPDGAHTATAHLQGDATDAERIGDEVGKTLLKDGQDILALTA